MFYTWFLLACIFRTFLLTRSPLLVVLCVFLLHGPSLDVPFGFLLFYP